VGGACGTHGRERKVYKFWWGSPNERDHLKDQDVDGRMESEWILGRLVGGVEWIQLTKDWDRWRALVNDETADYGATDLVILIFTSLITIFHIPVRHVFHAPEGIRI
jgi:hypothetical protein